MTDDVGERDIFKDHVATYKKYDDTLETLQWKTPGSSTYAIWYVRQYGTLMIWGDCYEATYQWSFQKGMDLRWISRCSLDYFVGKCRASENGRDPTVYDSHEMEKEMKEYFSNGCSYKEPLCPEGECECCDRTRSEEKLFEEHAGWSYMEDEHTWVGWLRDYADEVFGQDWWESIPSGRVLGPCIPLHLEGLKAAVAQLDTKEPEEEMKNEGTYNPYSL